MRSAAVCTLVAAALGVGCGGSADGDAADAPAIRAPTPYVPDLPPAADGPAARLDAAAVAAAITARVPELLGADLAAVPDLVEGFVDLAAPGCPGGERFEEGEASGLAVENDCITADGYRFRGLLSITRFTEAEGAVRGFSVDAGGVRIEAPDGRFVELDGFFGGSSERFDEVVGHNTYLGARLAADAETAGGNPWLDGTFEGRLERWSYREPGGVAMGLSGSVALAGGAVSAVAVSGLHFDSWSCGAEPSGVVSVREADGVWHDVVFDGFRDDEGEGQGVPEGDEAVCDGCGAHLVAGVDAGTVCAEAGWVEAIFEGIGR